MTKTTPSKSIDRRSFIRGASSAALGAAALGAAGPATAADRFDYDVIVIGGGFAGITASRDLMQQGLKTLVLEARDRLGGRTFTTEFADHHIELGGTWIHWFQPHVWAEVNRYGLELDEMIPPQDQQISIEIDGTTTISPLLENVGMLGALFDRIFPDARLIWERPYDQAYRWDELISREPKTMQDRLDEMDISPAEKTVTQAVLTAMGHTTLDKQSYVEMARWYAVAGWNFFGLQDTTARYMFAQGTISLINAMVTDGGQEIRMGSVVESVTQRPDHVTIQTQDGDIVTARALINTIPMNVLGDVSFTPPLSDLKQTAAQERHCAQGVKVYAQVKGHPDKVLGLSSDKAPIAIWMPYKILQDSTLYLGFGAHADGLNPTDIDAVQASLRTHLPDVQVIDSIGHPWTADPFSQGTYCSYRPGQLKRFGTEMTRHEGRIFMGSGDHGEGWRGFIDGAIARGSRVAQDTAAFLKSEG